MITRTGTQLHDFQFEDVRRINRDFDGRCLIGSEVGLGKTVTSLCYADRYLSDVSGPIICVVPAHLKLTWSRECLKHFGWRAEILSGQRVPPEGYPVSDDPNRVYVINYDILCPPNWRRGSNLPLDSWLRWLLRLRPRLLIADEGHYLGNHGTTRTSAVRKLARKCPHVLILTGTPIANKPPQLWPLLNILNPHLYPSRHDFCSEYTHARRQWYGWEYKGARNLESLHARLESEVMVRRRKADVMDQLPAVTNTVIPIEVDLREYRRAESNFVGWLESEQPLMARNVAKAEELSKLHFLKRMAGRLKLNAVMRWVDDFLTDTDSKLLLGAIHYAVTTPLMEEFGKRAVNVNGKMNDRQKQHAFDRFNTDRTCRLLIGNVQAAGTGWSCTSTSDGALIELPWVPGEVTQFTGRLHGISRGKEGVPVHMRFLVAQDTVEMDICNLLQIKHMWSRRAIDGLPADEDFGLYDRIKDCIRARAGEKVKS